LIIICSIVDRVLYVLIIQIRGAQWTELGWVRIGLLAIWVASGFYVENDWVGLTHDDLLLAYFKMDQAGTKKFYIIIIVMYKALVVSLTNCSLQISTISRLKD